VPAPKFQPQTKFPILRQKGSFMTDVNSTDVQQENSEQTAEELAAKKLADSFPLPPSLTHEDGYFKAKTSRHPIVLLDKTTKKDNSKQMPSAKAAELQPSSTIVQRP
jgi:hypothetical protein